jgi:hypothetical protein
MLSAQYQPLQAAQLSPPHHWLLLCHSLLWLPLRRERC